jgi:hypothetical protein
LDAPHLGGDSIEQPRTTDGNGGVKRLDGLGEPFPRDFVVTVVLNDLRG